MFWWKMYKTTYAWFSLFSLCAVTVYVFSQGARIMIQLDWCELEFLRMFFLHVGRDEAPFFNVFYKMVFTFFIMNVQCDQKKDQKIGTQICSSIFPPISLPLTLSSSSKLLLASLRHNTLFKWWMGSLFSFYFMNCIWSQNIIWISLKIETSWYTV